MSSCPLHQIPCYLHHCQLNLHALEHEKQHHYDEPLDTQGHLHLWVSLTRRDIAHASDARRGATFVDERFIASSIFLGEPIERSLRSGAIPEARSVRRDP